MKVTLPKDYRKVFTLEQMDMARQIIKDMKDDTSKPEEYAEMAINHYGWHSAGVNWNCVEVLRAKAEICKNGYELHPYGDGFDNLDIWIRFTAKTYCGFVEGGAYLSDIWQMSSEDERWDRFYIKRYKRDFD